MDYCEAINTIVPVQCAMGVGFWIAVAIVLFIVVVAYNYKPRVKVVS